MGIRGIVQKKTACSCQLSFSLSLSHYNSLFYLSSHLWIRQRSSCTAVSNDSTYAWIHINRSSSISTPPKPRRLTSSDLSFWILSLVNHFSLKLLWQQLLSSRSPLLSLWYILWVSWLMLTSSSLISFSLCAKFLVHQTWQEADSELRT